MILLAFGSVFAGGLFAVGALCSTGWNPSSDS